MESELLKNRIIPLMLLENGRLVKTKGFISPRVVGNPVNAAKVYSDQDADEIMLLNINSPDSDFDGFMEIVSTVSKSILTPITIGGHIDSFQRATEAFKAGADKVLVNSGALRDPELISQISQTFGSQALVVGVDFKVEASGPVIYGSRGTKRASISLIEHLERAVDLGAGELFLQSIDRDGTKVGLDLESAQYVRGIWNLPLVLAGGVGTFNDLLDGFRIGAEGIGCGTLFNFGDNNPIRAKAYLRNYDIPLKSN